MARILRCILLAICSCLLLSRGSAQDAEKARAVDPYRSGVPTSFAPYSLYPLDPLAARLAGMADLTRAAGTYHALVQEAAEKRQQVRAMKLKNREEELKYLKMRHDSLRDMHQEDLERAIKDEEKRARERAPVTEVVVGRAMNLILDTLKRDLRTPATTSQRIEQEWVDGINFVVTGGNAGLLRQKTLTWPVLLKEPRFAGQRERIEFLLGELRKDVKAATDSSAVYKDLLEQHRKLEEGVTIELTNPKSNWGPIDHIYAARFLKELKQILVLLHNPKDAAYLLANAPRCKTVAELVEHMRKNGLTFGPASAGQARAYISLHEALALEARQLAK